MKKSAFLIILILSSASAEIPIPAGRFKRDIGAVPCSSQKLAKAIIQQKNIVPTVIFHFGKGRYLKENISARTIKPEIWTAYFRGTTATLKQAPFRQGLYGCTHPYDCDYYADYSDPWLMAIRISEKCRAPERVATLIGLTSNLRTFHTPNLRRRLLACYPNGIENYPKNVRAIDGAKYPRTDCENALEEFLVRNDIKVVHDGITTRSWYIRDRECIQTIYGTPDDIVELTNKIPKHTDLLCKERGQNGDTGAEIERFPTGDGMKRTSESARLEH